MKFSPIKKMSIIHILSGLSLVVLLPACFVAKPYQRPQQLTEDSYYRLDKSSSDTQTMASVSWRQLFTDDKLTGYLEQAQENNLDIRNALQQMTAAAAYLKQGRAAYFPTLSASPSVSYQTNSLNTPFGMLGGAERQQVVQYGLSADLSWEADIWGKIKSNEKAAQASYLRTRAAHQAVTAQLVANIASTYYQLLALDEQKKITKETIEYRSQNLATTRALKAAGMVTEVAVKQSEAQLINAKGILVNLDKNIQLMENYFCMLLSIPPQPIPRNTLEQQQVSTPLATGVPAQLLANRPDVSAAEYNLMNSFELTNVARASFYPALRLTASGGLQSVDLDKLFSVNALFATAAGSLLQPILNKRQIRTQHEVAKANQEIAYNDYKKSILNASREVSDALFTYQAQQELIYLKKQEYLQYDTAVQYSQQLLNNGMANYLEVLSALSNSLQAQLNYVDARYGRLSAIVQLYKALGGGWR